MPTFRTGDMWSAYDEADYFIITTNATSRRDGALVMGRGIARQVRDRFPGFDLKAGAAVRRRAEDGVYGLLLGRKLGLFQVKFHWRDQADPALIWRSAGDLARTAEQHPQLIFHLNYPGIGNGRLPREQVAEALRQLPDNVHVWTYA